MNRLAAMLLTGCGAFAAVIGSQALAFALPDVAGAYDISAMEASWLTASMNILQIMVIPIVPWAAAALTLRRFGLLLCALQIAGCVMVLTRFSLIIGCFGMGLIGIGAGAFSTLMMTFVMQNFPPGKARCIGLGIFAFCVSLPTALACKFAGVTLYCGGWSLPLALGMVWPVAFAVGMMRIFPRAPLNTSLLSRLNWGGTAMLSLGAGTLVLAFTQGEVRFWLQNPIIVIAFAAGITMLLTSVWMLLTDKRVPCLDLRLFMMPSFGWATLIVTCYRVGLLMASWAVPQYLSRIQGFRPEQICDALLWMAAGQIVAFPLSVWYCWRVDARHALATGLLLFAASALSDSFLTPEWHGVNFIASLVLAGLGQGFFISSLLIIATSDLKPEDGPTAAGAFNLSRVFGLTGGTALAAHLLNEREKFHSAILVEQLQNPNPQATERLNQLAGGFLSGHGDAPLASAQAYQALAASASKQAFVLAHNDLFLALSVLMAFSAYLVFMLPRISLTQHPLPEKTP